MSKKYDVIIIGAGIGGLTCGCYLARQGLKVLIVEQHDKAGGYCVSFNRKGYRFDAAVHYLGGVKSGVLRNILCELDLNDRIKFYQSDPADKIIMPDSVAYIRANPRDTIQGLKKSFQGQKRNIDNFFKFIMQGDISKIYTKIRKMTLKGLLSEFFTNEYLTNSLNVLFLGNLGLPPSKLSAFTAVVLFKEFLLDPGYYPEGGMQAFPDLLTDKFKECGGEIVFSTKAKKILMTRDCVKGVKLISGANIESSRVVSNIDATQTFKKLIDNKTREAEIIDTMKPSNSIFSIYVGTKKPLSSFLNNFSNIWYFSTYNIEDCYFSLHKNMIARKIPGIMLFFPSFHDRTLKNLNLNTIQMMTMAPYETSGFWKKNRTPIAEAMFSLAEKALPSLWKNIDLKITATPETFFRYTLNREGSAFGWESTLGQIKPALLPQRTSVPGLFLVGHWCTMGGGQGGISTVALSGKRAAESILNEINL